MSMIGNFLAISEEKAQELRENPSNIPDYLYSEEIQESDSYLDIDKAWNGIHFLLTGTTFGGEEPLCWVVLGGETIGEDVGYGPARFVNAKDVKTINEAISGIDSSSLNDRFNPDELNDSEVYPSVWEQDHAEYLIGAYEDVKAFYASASKNNQCVIQFIS